jgi:hypothetical protein
MPWPLQGRGEAFHPEWPLDLLVPVVSEMNAIE